MDDKTIDVLGIVIPKESPLFLTIVALHIAIALVAVVSGVVALCATFGRCAARRHPNPRLDVHLFGMGGSYVVLLTAFYVDNGKNLPLWKELPTIAYWTVPALFGVPLIPRTRLRHPLLRGAHRPPSAKHG